MQSMNKICKGCELALLCIIREWSRAVSPYFFFLPDRCVYLCVHCNRVSITHYAEDGVRFVKVNRRQGCKLAMNTCLCTECHCKGTKCYDEANKQVL